MINQTAYPEYGKFLWYQHIHDSFRIPVELMLQTNLTVSAYKKLLREGHTLPKFWASVFDAWFRCRRVPMTNIAQNLGDMLQRPIVFCGSHALNRSWDHYVKNFDRLTELEMVTMDQFLRKQDTHATDDAIYNTWRYLPPEWRYMDATSVDLDLTLYGAVADRKYSVKQLYQFLRDSKKVTPGAIMKWESDSNGDITQELWYTSCCKGASVSDPRVRAFHLKILNRAYWLRSALAHFMECTNLCTYCDSEKETWLHLCWDCPRVKPAIIKFKMMCIEYLDMDNNEWSKVNFIMSIFSSKLFVLLSILLKRFIFIVKWQCHFKRADNVTVNFQSFLKYLRNYIQTEFLAAKYANKERSHYAFWGVLAEDQFQEEWDVLYDDFI